MPRLHLANAKNFGCNAALLHLGCLHLDGSQWPSAQCHPDQCHQQCKRQAAQEDAAGVVWVHLHARDPRDAPATDGQHGNELFEKTIMAHYHLNRSKHVSLMRQFLAMRLLLRLDGFLGQQVAKHRCLRSTLGLHKVSGGYVQVQPRSNPQATSGDSSWMAW